MEGMAQDWKRLADHVITRRVQLGMMDRRDLRDATGITERTIGQLERGHSVSASTLAKIELTLEWPPGTARRILDGGEPDTAVPARQPDSPRYSDPSLQRIWDDPGLTDAEKHGIVALVMGMRANAASEDGAPRRTA